MVLILQLNSNKINLYYYLCLADQSDKWLVMRDETCDMTCDEWHDMWHEKWYDM
jgi:hypothetical protein